MRRRHTRVSLLTALALVLACPQPVSADVPSQPFPAYLGVTAREWTITLSRPAVVGPDVIVQFTNRGEDIHDLRLQRSGTSERLAIPETESGKLGSGRFAMAAGTWQLWCSLPGHAEVGMQATLTVDASAVPAADVGSAGPTQTESVDGGAPEGTTTALPAVSPPGPLPFGASPDRRPPALRLSAPRSQRVRRGSVIVLASCDEGCRVSAPPLAAAAGRADLRARAPKKVRVRLARSLRSRVRRTLEMHGRAAVRVELQAVDASGNVSSQSVRLGLRP